MGEENHKKTDESTELTSPSEELGELDGSYEVTVKKGTNEIVIRDSSGKTVRLHGTVDVADDDDEEEVKPLTPSQFRTALKQLDALGLTWTADSIPAIKAKDDGKNETMFGEELAKLQREYPHLPSELSLVIAHAITGTRVPSQRVGNVEDLRAKAEIVREVLITPEFKAEFFFKHSIKLPYFAGMDWEVVFKLVENNVSDVPGISYALLSLVYHYPSVVSGRHRHENITVAVNSELVDKMIGDLNKLKQALEVGARLTKTMHTLKIEEGEKGEEDDNATANTKGLE
ncbi:MAG: hypothetical protein AABN34_24035 [Acidobacteriota bacterium]